MFDWLWSTSDGINADSRGRPLQGKSPVVEASRATSRFVVTVVLAIAGCIAVLIAIVASFSQFLVILDTVPAPGGLVIAILYAGLALTLIIQLSRGESPKKQHVDWTQIPLVKECLACGYGLEHVPRAQDGCVVCPECGAAWRETPDDKLQPLWHFRSKGLLRDRVGQPVAILREISDDELLAKLALPRAATTRTIRIICISLFLTAATLTFVASGLRSSELAMLCAAISMLTMATGCGVLAHRAQAVRRAVDDMLRTGICPHCRHALTQDGVMRRCDMCGCMW
ncbi:MAG TPA: hypothetical protein VK157_09125 [Phycisphaerales bacterium]|nr:hypothetical protein [Phycisphaerales bacterium]